MKTRKEMTIMKNERKNKGCEMKGNGQMNGEKM